MKIVNPLGLHARAAARFVHLASGFASSIRVSRQGREMDGKSIMGLLLLSAAQGTDITISAEGPDETAALAALCALVHRGFDEISFDSPGEDSPGEGSRDGGLAHGGEDQGRGTSCD